MSLSPRPERFTRRLALFGSVGASFMAYATACADSSAGMMPSAWHSSWNAGLRWEVSTDDNASFFVEARYQRIAEFNNKAQFVPIRVGLRF